MSTRNLQQMLSREEFSDVVDETSVSSTGNGAGEAADAADAAVEGKPQAGDVINNPMTGAGESVISTPSKDSSEAAVLKEIEQAEVAVEAYVGFMKKHEAQGISAESAAAMQIGLARYAALLEKHVPAAVSTENFGGAFSRRQATGQAIEAYTKALASLRQAKAPLTPKK